MRRWVNYLLWLHGTMKEMKNSIRKNYTGKAPDNTFRVTKSRLKRMLENIVLNDKSLTGYQSPAINARLQVQKKLLQGEIY